MEDAGLFWFLLVLVLLLVAFVYQIVTLPPHLAVPAPPPEPPPELEPPAASPELEPSARPLWRAPARPGEAGYQAPHTPRGGGPQVPARGLRPPAVGPAAGWTLAIAGLTIALAGGWLFHRAGVGTGTCSHHAAVACSQGYVLFTDAQVLGGAICLAGIIAALAGLYLALRDRPRP
jgi:hypothetical protein